MKEKKWMRHIVGGDTGRLWRDFIMVISWCGIICAGAGTIACTTVPLKINEVYHAKEFGDGGQFRYRVGEIQIHDQYNVQNNEELVKGIYNQLISSINGENGTKGAQSVSRYRDLFISATIYQTVLEHRFDFLLSITIETILHTASGEEAARGLVIVESSYPITSHALLYSILKMSLQKIVTS